MTHHGIVLDVREGVASVELLNDDHDCSGCALSNVCTATGHTLSVKARGATREMIGQRVKLQATADTRTTALWLYMALPLIACLTALAICAATGLSDGASGAIASATLIIWYATLYLFRNKINTKVKFEIA